MQAAVGDAAWAQTAAVRWNFAGRNDHLWDRQRGFSRVKWGDYEVLLDVDGRRGLVLEKGKPVNGAEAAKKVDEAHAKWVNDAFWLNPVMKAFDPGTVREVVPADDDGHRGVLVRYVTGGRTPGDSYLWRLGKDDKPVSWQMWTSNIPVGGLSASWAKWVKLDSGAWVSTEHETPAFTLELTDVAGAKSLTALVGKDDPFAALVACRADNSCIAAAP